MTKRAIPTRQEVREAVEPCIQLATRAIEDKIRRNGYDGEVRVEIVWDVKFHFSALDRLMDMLEGGNKQ